MPGTIAARLMAKGLELPTPVMPVGTYVTSVRTGNLAVFSGHGPLREGGKSKFQGPVGVDFSIEEASEIAIGATLNVMASAQALLGDLDEIECILTANGFVTCDGEITNPVAVFEPALTLLSELFGSPPAATVMPAVSLPNNIPVLLEVIAKVRSGEASPD